MVVLHLANASQVTLAHTAKTVIKYFFVKSTQQRSLLIVVINEKK